MSPRMTGHFVESTVRLRRKTRNFYNGEKFRRTRKELIMSPKMTGHFVVKRTVGLKRTWELLMRSSISKKKYALGAYEFRTPSPHGKYSYTIISFLKAY